MQQTDTGFGQGLRGLRVLDFTWAGAGPMCAQLLCLMGADVVKVESAQRPDLLRISGLAYGWGVTSLETNSGFNDMNAGKRSIEIDLKHPEGRALAWRLALAADVVCDNMRPGKMEALGLGYAALRAARPDIICCSVSATGRSEGHAIPEVPGYGPVFWAEGGGASVTGFPDGEPTYMRAPADMNAGTYAAAGVLAALIHRDRTGEGAYVDCSAIESVSAVIGTELLEQSVGLPVRGRGGNDCPPWAPNDVLPCSGIDQWVAVSIRAQSEWTALCEVLGAPELLADDSLRSRLTRWRRRSELTERLSSLTSTWNSEELARVLQKRGVAAAASRNLKAALDDEELNRRGFWQTTVHPVMGQQKIGTLAWTMDPPLPPARPSPLLGQHTADVMVSWLDMNEADIEKLLQAGAIQQQTPDGVKSASAAPEAVA